MYSYNLHSRRVPKIVQEKKPEYQYIKILRQGITLHFIPIEALVFFEDTVKTIENGLHYELSCKKYIGQKYYPGSASIICEMDIYIEKNKNWLVVVIFLVIIFS